MKLWLIAQTAVVHMLRRQDLSAHRLWDISSNTLRGHKVASLEVETFDCLQTRTARSHRYVFLDLVFAPVCVILSNICRPRWSDYHSALQLHLVQNRYSQLLCCTLSRCWISSLSRIYNCFIGDIFEHVVPLAKRRCAPQNVDWYSRLFLGAYYTSLMEYQSRARTCLSAITKHTVVGILHLR